MRTADIAKRYLDYFAKHDHLIVPSASLISPNPTTLFTIAGMVPFIPYLMGEQTPPKRRMASNQKCVRTLDIDEVGKTTRHGTFFQMLGNFSFGDYFKEEAIHYAWELLTTSQDEGGYGFDPEKLWMTTFTDDDEARSMWINEGVDPEHIQKMGMEDNFWTTGGPGPGGPCSEIYVDRGPAFGKEGGPIADENRYIEIWDLVFENYEVDNVKSKTDLHIVGELENKNIDTGAGLERLAYLLQGKNNIYETDEVFPVIEAAEQLSGLKYGENEDADVRFRVVADHVRSALMIMSDGVRPSNVGRGYVLRRLLRRAVFHGRLLGIEDAFLGRFIDAVNDVMGDAYPSLLENVGLVKGIVEAEEERFSTTLNNGRVYLDEQLSALAEGEQLPGSAAFMLHDTFGFPIDLTVEIAEGAGHAVDIEGFNAEMAEQKARARAAAKGDAWGSFNDVWTELADQLPATEFVGYDNESIEGAHVLAIVVNGERVERADNAAEAAVVLDRTPLYAEMGGQMGDHGLIDTDDAQFFVSNTTAKGGLYVHEGKLIGALSEGDTVFAGYDLNRRGLLRRNHTATHLLDAALKEVLGDHVNQAGSLVSPENLRFDFTHFEAMTSEQIRAVEDLVNEQILAAQPVVTQVMGIDEAKASGAVALFGEKYGDVVRVVSVGEGAEPFSRELCGGTHAKNTAELGLFKIVSESSTGSNVRRIEAVTSTGAIAYLEERAALAETAAASLKCRVEEVPARVHALQAELREVNQKLKKALTGGSSDAIASAIDAAVDMGGYQLVVAELSGLEAADLRNVWDTIRGKLSGACACVLATVTEKGTPALIAAATDDAAAAGFHAGNVIKQIAPLVDGRGGGKPTMAQAGGKNAAGIAAALDAARSLLAE